MRTSASWSASRIAIHSNSGAGDPARSGSPRILLLSAYDTTSHRLWRERLRELFPDADWCQLSLPARHFEWRLRSNSLHWGLQDMPEFDAEWDLLIATSMVDLAALRGLRPRLARIPTLLYFHENQFFYPDNPGSTRKRESNVEPLLIPVYSALCADRIVFNSEFNRQTFLRGAKDLFARLPDNLPAQAWQKLEASSVIPVPIASDCSGQSPRAPRTHLEVIWNHRWEFDKGPELLLEIARELLASDAPIRLHVLGQQFRKQPQEFAEIEELCGQLAARQQLAAPQIGYLEDRSEYEELLGKCDVVLSTAWHEFQGLGVQEACLAGCCPLAPDDLAYPEYLPAECLYERGADSHASAKQVLRRLLEWHAMARAGESLPVPTLDAYCGEQIRERYQQVFTELASPAQ